MGIAGPVCASNLYCLSDREIFLICLYAYWKFEIGDFEFRTLTEEIPFLREDLVFLEEIY